MCRNRVFAVFRIRRHSFSLIKAKPPGLFHRRVFFSFFKLLLLLTVTYRPFYTPPRLSPRFFFFCFQMTTVVHRNLPFILHPAAAVPLFLERDRRASSYPSPTHCFLRRWRRWLRTGPPTATPRSDRPDTSRPVVSKYV